MAKRLHTENYPQFKYQQMQRGCVQSYLSKGFWDNIETLLIYYFIFSPVFLGGPFFFFLFFFSVVEEIWFLISISVGILQVKLLQFTHLSSSGRLLDSSTDHLSPFAGFWQTLLCSRWECGNCNIGRKLTLREQVRERKNTFANDLETTRQTPICNI